MKTNKQFSIDVEIAEKLKDVNASKLISGLLKEHFDLRKGKNTLKEEKMAVLASISKKKKNFLRRLRLLLSGIRSILIILVRNGLKNGRKFLRLRTLTSISTKKKAISLSSKSSELTSSTKNTENS